MSANNGQQQSSEKTLVSVSNWIACFNSNDDTIVLSCTVSGLNSDDNISGVGLILNTVDGKTLVSIYVTASSGSATVFPSLNLPSGRLRAGHEVSAVVQGQCNGEHFFFQQSLKISDC